MKKIFKALYTLPVVALVTASSCSKKIDEAFANPNATVRVPVETLLPGIEANMVTSYSAAGTGYGPQNDGLYIGRYVQYWATNTTANQYDRMAGATGASDILGAIWAMHYYGHGQNLNRMIDWATEEGKWDYVGVGQAIRAWGWMTLTDTYGEAILTQAFDRSRLTFAYNTEQEMYAEAQRLCHLAIENLNKPVTGSNLATADEFLNGGNIDKWKKFVYGVLAKTYHRRSKKSDYVSGGYADSVIKYSNLSAAVNADNTFYHWSLAQGTGTYSYYSPFRSNAGALRQTKFIADLMSGLNNAFLGVPDPRGLYIIRENTNNTLKGTRPNKGTDGLATNDQPRNFWGGTFATTTAPSTDATARYIFRNNPVWPLQTASEILFMKAEAYFLKGDKPNALIAYTAGINQNFDQLIADYQTNLPDANKITPATRTAYLGNAVVIPAAANLTLAKIMLQKYIATYGWGFIETWVDMRRYHYTDIEPGGTAQVYTDFAPPTGTDLWLDNNSKFVYRARPRYNSEYIYNIAELQRIGAMALDYNTKQPWFALP